MLPLVLLCVAKEEPFMLNLKHRILKEITITRTTGKPLRNEPGTHILPDLSAILVYGFVPEIEKYTIDGKQLPSIYLYRDSRYRADRLQIINQAFRLRSSFQYTVGSKSSSCINWLRTFDGINFWYAIKRDTYDGIHEFGRATLDGKTWQMAVTPQRPSKVINEPYHNSDFDEDGAIVTGTVDKSGEQLILIRLEFNKVVRNFPGQLPPMNAPAEFKLGTLASWDKYKPFSADLFKMPYARSVPDLCEYSAESQRLLFGQSIFDLRKGSWITNISGNMDAIFLDRGEKLLSGLYDRSGTFLLDIKSKEEVLVSKWALVAHTANGRYVLLEAPKSTRQVLLDLEPDRPSPPNLKIP